MICKILMRKRLWMLCLLKIEGSKVQSLRRFLVCCPSSFLFSLFSFLCSYVNRAVIMYFDLVGTNYQWSNYKNTYVKV